MERADLRDAKAALGRSDLRNAEEALGRVSVRDAKAAGRVRLRDVGLGKGTDIR